MTFVILSRAQSIKIGLFGIISLILTSINTPLVNFPGQDVLLNDLLLLGRVAWAKAALMNNVFASIDFLQGLGANLRLDVKVVPHFFDPAVLFSFFTGHFSGLWLRTFFLIFYCLWCLDRLWIQQFGDSTEPTFRENIRFPLFLFYLISPQLIHDVSHHFSAIFYSIPGVLVGARSVAIKGTIASRVGFVAATILFVSLSDLHIVFIGGTLVVFVALFDPLLRKGSPRAIASVFVSFCLILILSYASFLDYLSGVISGGREEIVTAAGGAWPLDFYTRTFLVTAAYSLVIPGFANPVALYLTPYIILFLAVLVMFWKAKTAARNFLMLLGLLAGLFALGAALHGLEFTRIRLPSAMRYHLAIIPFLANLWILFHAGDVTNVLVGRSTRHFIRWDVLILLLALIILMNVYFVDTFLGYFRRVPVTPALVFEDIVLKMSLTTWKNFTKVELFLFPVLFLVAVGVGSVFKMQTIRGATFCTLGVLMVSLLSYTTRATIVGTYSDRDLFRILYRDLPATLNSLIEQGAYVSAPRSVVPIAVGPEGERSLRGRNDKLMPFIEFPDHLNARTFFQYRYSYTAHTSVLYDGYAHGGRTNTFPPSTLYTREAVDFAILTDSPFMLSADAELGDDRLELIGSYEIPGRYVVDKPEVNRSLVGKIHLYAVKPVMTAVVSGPFRSVEYSRVWIRFRGLQTGDSEIRLPVTYQRDLRVWNEVGEAVEAFRGADGFVWVRNDGSFRDLTVSSFSPIAIMPLMAPIVGVLALCFVRRREV